MKLTLPIVELARHVPWAGEYPRMVRMMGAIDLLGAIGLFVPVLTGFWPRLTVSAAIGCFAPIIAAIALHLARGGAWATPINIAYLAPAAYVSWARTRVLAAAPHET